VELDDQGGNDLASAPRTGVVTAPAPSAAGQPHLAGVWTAWRRRCGVAALILAAVVVGLWLLDITGPVDEGRHRVPAALARVAIAAALGAGGAWLAAGMAARLAGRRHQMAADLTEGRPQLAAGLIGRHRNNAAALVLPGLIALSFAVRFAGLDSEVSGRYYLDEGTYYHHATAINGGEVLRRTFVYPHLTYYADALILWMAERFPQLVAALARRLYGLEEPLAVSWLLLRGFVALLSALTVVPVYRLGRWLAGPAAPSGRAAGLLAAGLLILSDLFNEGSHLNTCDVPSAFFATLCLLLVARLVDGESRRGYVLAGVAAGLAAASKYPAGLVALAIAVVWAGWRVRRRDWNAGLLWAALAAAAAVVAVMPSLLAYPDMAFTGPRGIFFGAHQYGQKGWLGVMPDSNAAFYGDKLLATFGWPATAAGLAGLALIALRRESRARQHWRLLWLAPYPLAYLGLVTAMNMVVKRNLYPVLPAAAAFLGAGLAAWLDLVWDLTRAGLSRAGGAAMEPAGPERVSGAGPAEVEPQKGLTEIARDRATAPAVPAGHLPQCPPAEPRRRRWLLQAANWRRVWRWAAALAALACLWPPADVVARQSVGYVTPSTREEAAAWMRAHLPPGAALVKESYTPDFPEGLFAVSHERFAGRIRLSELRSPQNDYLLLSSAAYSRFADADALFTDNQREIARRYDEIFRTFPLIREWIPDELQLGPVLRLYRIDPDPATCRSLADLTAADAFASDEAAMRPDPERPIRYTAPGQWSLFRACLPAGRYELSLRGHLLPPAQVEVTDVAGRRLALLAPVQSSAVGEASSGGAIDPAASPLIAGLELGGSGKVLFYVRLGLSSRLRGMSLAGR
jgi:4-amino-4-deoxy-L-arabinose transferase-like glycosyltransferase